jgi:hypothetical protein
LHSWSDNDTVVVTAALNGIALEKFEPMSAPMFTISTSYLITGRVSSSMVPFFFFCIFIPLFVLFADEQATRIDECRR